MKWGRKNEGIKRVFVIHRFLASRDPINKTKKRGERCTGISRVLKIRHDPINNSESRPHIVIDARRVFPAIIDPGYRVTMHTRTFYRK